MLQGGCGISQQILLNGMSGLQEASYIVQCHWILFNDERDAPFLDRSSNSISREETWGLELCGISPQATWSLVPLVL